jgi:molybdate transport system substrate-binding protein
MLNNYVLSLIIGGRKSPMGNFRTTCLVIMALSVECAASASEPASLNLAVAANFTRPMWEICRVFTEQTGIILKPVYSSTGKLYAQIKYGAPFDLFLAADSRRPGTLFKDGLAYKPAIYALGRTVLWTADRTLCSKTSWQDVITDMKLQKISVPSPETAPYGEAAANALKKTKLWEGVASRLIFAQSVSQSFQYAQMKGADAAFTALSCATCADGKNGCYWKIPDAQPIVQEACILTRTKKLAAAKEFLNFLTSSAIKPILKKYGYR